MENRPWGTFTVLKESKNYKVKQIEVLPGCRLSLQRHSHRSEHWVVVSGNAVVTCGKNQSIYQPNSYIFIPILETHRLENPGTELLIVIETQCGNYLGEDDIERLSDDYNRAL